MTRILSLFSMLMLLSFIGHSQSTTLFMKPNAIVGKDATIGTTYGCTPFWSSAPYETTPVPSSDELSYMDWTLNAGGCSRVTLRGLLQFDSLNNIPAGATIVSATLSLFGVPSSSNFGNSSFPSSAYGTTNEGWVQRVTSAWNEATVTWNTQPGVDTTHQVQIPVSTSQFSWNTSLNVTSLIQDIVNSGNNNGMLLLLDDENFYRSVLFASSDHADSTLWPELVVSYTIPSTSCQPNFDWITGTNQPNFYTFLSQDSASSVSYAWSINNTTLGSANTLFDYFQSTAATAYNVCHTKTTDTSCNTCLDFCHGERDLFIDDTAGTCNTHFDIIGSSTDDSIYLRAQNNTQPGSYTWLVSYQGAPYLTFSGTSTPRFQVFGGGWYDFKLIVNSGSGECYRTSFHYCFTDSLPGVVSVKNNVETRIAAVAPNPASGFTKIYLEAPAVNNIAVNLSTLTGQLVYSGTIARGTSSIYIPMETLSTGIYLISVEDGKTVLHQKLMKE